MLHMTLKLGSGREITFGTAIGDLLHYRQHVSSGSNEALLKDAFEKFKWHIEESSECSGGDRTAHPSDTDLSGRKNGQAGPNENKKKKWIWWGKPMWHDLGYCAVSWRFLK